MSSTIIMESAFAPAAFATAAASGVASASGMSPLTKVILISGAVALVIFILIWIVNEYYPDREPVQPA